MIATQTAYLELLRQADACEKLFNQAGIEKPAPLLRFLESIRVGVVSIGSFIDGNQTLPSPGTAAALVASPEARIKPTVDYSGTLKNQTFTIPHEPFRGFLPQGADKTWVPIPVKEASPQALTFAVMRQMKDPLPIARISAIVGDLRGKPGTTGGYNVVRRFMETGAMLETPEGIHLVSKEAGGLFEEDTLWIPPTQLTDADAAYHRREGILEFLKLNTGLSTASISRGLQTCGWIKTPLNAHHVKADLGVLEKEGIIERMPDKGWRLKDQQKTPP